MVRPDTGVGVAQDFSCAMYASVAKFQSTHTAPDCVLGRN